MGNEVVMPSGDMQLSCQINILRYRRIQLLSLRSSVPCKCSHRYVSCLYALRVCVTTTQRVPIK